MKFFENARFKPNPARYMMVTDPTNDYYIDAQRAVKMFISEGADLRQCIKSYGKIRDSQGNGWDLVFALYGLDLVGKQIKGFDKNITVCLVEKGWTGNVTVQFTAEDSLEIANTYCTAYGGNECTPYYSEQDFLPSF